MRVSLVEYGIGNIQSVANALARVGAAPHIVRNGEELLADRVDCIVLPGVGAVGEALSKLRERNLDDALRQRVVDERVPFLGICVGMQMLAETCMEFGRYQGLGWIPGVVRRLGQSGGGLRLPHVGWNDITAKADGMLGSFSGEHFYFVHSYAFECDGKYSVATADYGEPFVAAVAHGHIHGVQFHPEKSSGAGEALLAAFLDRAKVAGNA